MELISITGASGFVGANLIAYLKPLGYQVNTIDRNTLKEITAVQIAGTAVVHLAGKAHDLKKTANPNEYEEVNFELTKRLYNEFLKSSANLFIFVSSVKAAADEVKGILTEDVMPNPLTAYGKSKLMAEAYIQAQQLPQGKFFYILRPCMIHGPGNKGNLNLLYQLVKKGIPYPLVAFTNQRSFLSIENLCFVIKEILKQQIPSGIYNVADDEALATTDVVGILASSLDKKPKLLHFPKLLIRLMASIGTKLSLPLNTEKLNKLTENYLVSNAKIKQAINKKLPINATEGLTLTAKSFAEDKA